MLSIIVSTIFISLVINVILKKYHLPTIIGYIITGTIIAYGFGLHDAIYNHDLKEIAEFGVVFLMFTIGLEFSLDHLKKMKYEVFVAGTLQITFTTAIVFIISYYLFDIAKYVSLIISLAIALSSTVIVLKIFNETGEINKRHGQRSLGILIMQDLAVIPILLVIGYLSNDDGRLRDVIVNMAVSAIGLLTILWFAGKYLLEPFFTRIVKTKSDELFVGTILFLAIGASYLAHILGFSYSLGAFIAGMLIAETKYKYRAEAELVPFRDILLGIFFITVGMQIDFSIILSYLHIIFALLIGVMVLKFIIIYALLRINEGKKVSLKTAFALVQIGEFSLALLELARTNNLIGPPYGQVMIVTIVISMVLTPFILKNLDILTSFFIKDNDHHIETDIDVALLRNHIVILGFGEFGNNVAHSLRERGELYVAVENSIEKFHHAFEKNEPIIFGNAMKKEVLAAVNIAMAKNVIIAINNPKTLYHTCQTIQRYISNDRIIVKVHSLQEKESIENLGIINIIVESQVISKSVLALILKTESF